MNIPSKNALQPYRGQFMSPQAPGSWLSPRGRDGLVLVVFLRAFSRARRSAAARLRRSVRRAVAACRLRWRSAVTRLRAAARIRCLKSDFGWQRWRRPRVLWQRGHSHVTGFCAR